MTKDLYDQINSALKDRDDWAKRQDSCYRMRNGGLRRSSKPYPGAPDGWYPLGDTMIEKQKPAYVQQVFGPETVANFVCLRQQDVDLTTAANYWFDYQLKQRSNFERTIFVAIDQMLEQAFTPIKVYYDAQCKRLAFDQVDPLHLIVPSTTQEYNEGGGADWLVHVLHLSEAEYRANPKFVQDDEFIKSIKGKGTSDAGSSDTGTDKKQSVDLKEGINCSGNDNEIVLWEVYRRDRKDRKIEVETISPLLPCQDDKNVVRAKFSLPYTKGVFKGGYAFPFFKIRAEIKGKGHYSSRGTIEINAPFETSLTKTWNNIHQHMDFTANPMFRKTVDIPNPSNFRTGTGRIMPYGLEYNPPPPLPSSLFQDMEATRAIAEDRTQIPDLGASQHVTGKPDSKGNPTATQINAIVGMSGQSNDLKARVFRLDLGEGLKMAWSIALQYLVVGQEQTSLQYLVENEVRVITPEALHEDYEITPNGSSDSWNKGQLVAKRMSYFQLLQGNPYIDQAELTKFMLEADDPRNIKRLFRDPGDQSKEQSEQQALECILMLNGWPAQVSPADDDKAHLVTMGQWIERRLMTNEPITPELARLVIQHGGAHDHQMEQKKDPQLKAFRAQAAPMLQLLGHIAQSDQPQNVVQMQPPGMQPTPPAQSEVGPPGAAAPLEAQPLTT